MARKRKRCGRNAEGMEKGDNKRRQIERPNIAKRDRIGHPTLQLYYRNVQTLGAYLLSVLPKHSKKRRRRLTKFIQFHQNNPLNGPTSGSLVDQSSWIQNVSSIDDLDQAQLLSIQLQRTLVCSADVAEPIGELETDLKIFSQQANGMAQSSLGRGNVSQSELVDYTIGRLFHRTYKQCYIPPHMLCRGYQRTKTSQQLDSLTAGDFGIESLHPNNNVQILKGFPWNSVLCLLGRDGDLIMHRMLLHCGIFVALENGKSNYFQLSGVPLTDLPVLDQNEGCKSPFGGPLASKRIGKKPTSHIASAEEPRRPANITFVRSRMLYSRATLNAKGRVSFGLRHIHALNRFPDPLKEAHTVTLLKYIFPRQFGLHNVFTSNVDSRETVQPFKDYTLREQEIARLTVLKQSRKRCTRGRDTDSVHIPKRLRGRPFELAQQLQRLHHRCSYNELLKYYCPSEHPTNVSSISDLATTQERVSAFSRAVITRLIPKDFWGEGSQGKEHQAILMRRIDLFVKLRRYESMSLHTAAQGLKVTAIGWLAPPKVDRASAMSKSDMIKRSEVWLEFVYYLFDSILVPLVRSNFHVTESSDQQNKMLYFRHDVWRTLTEPTIKDLKVNLLEEVNTQNAQKLLDGRPLGFSQIRLLPKTSSFRPIHNLKRRVGILRKGRAALGRSINKIMEPVFNILDYERRKQPDLVGSSLFSTSDMYPKLKAFAKKLHTGSIRPYRGLYFVKADARSCFDTIPQGEVVRLVADLISESHYSITPHCEVKVPKSYYYNRISASKVAEKAARKWRGTAKPARDSQDFPETMSSTIARSKKNTIFIQGNVPLPQKAETALNLLQEHVQRNITKIGKKFFRQKAGIPQGSVLSSILCSYFYADLEHQYFRFLDERESLFMRLIDDFLLITTNMAHATQFLQIMHDGVKSHGVEVNPAKSLASFEVTINGFRIPRHDGTEFPYCGNAIDVETLELVRDRSRRKNTVLANSLTVETSKTPGRTFHRKSLNAFKIQTHKMFLDTDLNRPATVLTTIYQNFFEVAMKYYRYAKSMPQGKQPSDELLKGTIRDLIDLAYVLIRDKHHRHGASEYRCAVSKRQVCWLAGRAFSQILRRKQAKYREILTWLGRLSADATVGARKEEGRLEGIAQQGEAVFAGYRY